MALCKNRRLRRGSALLVCTLAAVVISLAAVTMLRSSRRSIARIDAIQASDGGRHVADGLLQRSIALLRENPATAGTIVDPDGPNPDAFCQLTTLTATATQIQVFLYAGAAVPAIDMVVDPTAL